MKFIISKIYIKCFWKRFTNIFNKNEQHLIRILKWLTSPRLPSCPLQHRFACLEVLILNFLFHHLDIVKMWCAVQRLLWDCTGWRLSEALDFETWIPPQTTKHFYTTFTIIIFWGEKKNRITSWKNQKTSIMLLTLPGTLYLVTVQQRMQPEK